MNKGESGRICKVWLQRFLNKCFEQNSKLSKTNKIKVIGDLAFTQLFVTGANPKREQGIIGGIQICSIVSPNELRFLASQNEINPSTVYLIYFAIRADEQLDKNFLQILDKTVSGRSINRHFYSVTELMEYLAYKELEGENSQEKLTELFVEVTKATSILAFSTRYQRYGLTHRIFYITKLNRVKPSSVLKKNITKASVYQVQSLLWVSLLDADLDLSIELCMCLLLMNPEIEKSTIDGFYDLIRKMFQKMILEKLNQYETLEDGFKAYHTVLAFSILGRIINDFRQSNY